MKKFKYVFLFVSYLIYSFGGVIAKSSSQSDLLSLSTLSKYIAVLGILLIYSVMWQVTLKQFDLSVAFMGKGSVLIFGLVWAKVIFKETISITNIIGASTIIVGIAIFSYSKKISS